MAILTAIRTLTGIDQVLHMDTHNRPYTDTQAHAHRNINGWTDRQTDTQIHIIYRHTPLCAYSYTYMCVRVCVCVYVV